MKARCMCIQAPMGRHGLEGYGVGNTYTYERCLGPDYRTYFRVWPVDDEINYYETCRSMVFRQFFLPLEKPNEQ